MSNNNEKSWNDKKNNKPVLTSQIEKYNQPTQIKYKWYN